MRFTLRGARLVDATTNQSESGITIEEGSIKQVSQYNEREEKNVIDASDAIIMPGFIEVHTHGGGGFNLHTTRLDEIASYARWTPATGITSFLIAVVGTPDALPEQQLRTAVDAIERYKDAQVGAEPLGIHLEGPYINEKRRGAHPTNWLRLPNEYETELVLELTKGYLRLVTIAPELPGAEQMIRRLVAAGVTVSIGHTDANYEQAQDAIRWGITHATHCFNAMHPLLHREPGPIAAIAQASQMMGEVIVDGVHVHPAVVELLVRILGTERIIVVTDAQSVAGTAEGSIFEFAGQQAHVAHGAARLADGTLAGSVLTMDQALRNMLAMAHVSLQDAVRMLTLNPAQSAHVVTRKGRLQAGYDADLLIFDSALTLQATLCRGKVAFATEVWDRRLGIL